MIPSDAFAIGHRDFEIDLAQPSEERASQLRRYVQQGGAAVIRGVFTSKKLAEWRQYLVEIARGSFPAYHPIAPGSPNHHRINRFDPRSYVRGCFHQFSFFPWNQDLLNLFQELAPLYRLKNMASGSSPDKFYGPDPEENCIARPAFQFYPSGLGGMNKHRDPKSYHQHVLPILVMSKKGEDFKTGGAYVEDIERRRYYLEDFADPGDVVFMNPYVPHGVETIDSGMEADWLAFRGRWMLLLATNKIQGSQTVMDAMDLEKEG